MAQIMSALPVPVVLLDADNRFRFVNHAAEQFLGISASGLSQLRLRDLVPEDNPLFLLVEQVRKSDATVSDHDLSVDSPRLNKQGMTVQGSPLPEEPGAVLLVLQDASAARALDRQLAFRGAARSVTGMAAILAHEVKNPLSGIRGAAQLLETSVDAQDRELAVLIRDEADRIRALVDRMEIFGEKPIAPHCGEHPSRAGARAQAGAVRLRAACAVPGNLRSVAATGLGQSRPARAGDPQPGEERRRGGDPGGRRPIQRSP